MRGRRNPLNWPETNIFLFAFLLHFVWELLQLPLFSLSELTAWETILHCTRATFGDVVITYAAFLGTAWVARSRDWIVQGHRGATALFIAIGLVITVVFERLATGPLNRWVYAESMPIIPVLEVGASPVLQWIVLPMVLLWIMRRQLLGAQMVSAA